MTDEERDATGNETPSDGDLPEGESQAPESDSRERDQEAETWKRKYLEAKQAEEEANRLRREVDELRRLAQPPPATKRDDEDDDSDEDSAIRLLAEGDPAQGIRPDPVAKALLKERRERRREREERQELVQAIQWRDQLRDIDDKNERDEVRKRFDPRKHRDINEAHKEVQLDRLSERMKALEAENARLKAGDKANPNVTRTLTREVSASEHQQRQLPREQWKAKLDTMSDDERRKAMMERRAKLMNK